MVVRHPFERLVSAYEDKILNPQPHFQYHVKVQKQIKERRKGDDVKIDFPEDLLKEKFAKKFKGKVEKSILDHSLQSFIIVKMLKAKTEQGND